MTITINSYQQNEPIQPAYKILEKRSLTPTIKQIKIHAPEIAEKANAGQFVIIRLDEESERVPLTIVSWDKEAGTITLIFQEVGVSTKKLDCLHEGDEILNIAGPLGNPSHIENFGQAVVVCGGVGTAAAYPIARALKEAGNKVISIVGARTEGLLVLTDEMRAVSDELHISTDDGSKGCKGFVSDILKSLINQGYKFDIAYAIGPPIMMKTISDVTRPFGIKTVVSLNPIMVDGMGMCGACRVTVAGKTKFGCVDGPEFDAHTVDFDELIKRLRQYPSEEKLASAYQENAGGVCRCHRH